MKRNRKIQQRKVLRLKELNKAKAIERQEYRKLQGGRSWGCFKLTSANQSIRWNVR